LQQVMGSRRLRGGFFLALVLPSPRQELGYPPDWMIGQSREDVGEPGLRIDVVELGGLDQRVEKKTMLKLGIMCTIAPDQIIDLIGSIQRHHPGVELQLSTNAWDLQERLIGGALEVAIYCIPGEEPDPRLHVMPLFREQIVIAINPRHRLAKQDTIRVRDLDGECYIHRMNCAIRRLCRQGVPGAAGHLQAGVLERPRRLDAGDDRIRARLGLHAPGTPSTILGSSASRSPSRNSGARCI